MTWNDVYAQSETMWGSKPDMLLMEFAPQVPLGLVLDLGMGEGRNAFQFAQQGYEIFGIDSSRAAVQKAIERAETTDIPLHVRVGDMRQIEIEPDAWGLVIAAMSLQFMQYSDSERVLRCIKPGLRTGGFVYLAVFSTEDPGLERLRHTGSEVETNTYFIEQQNTHIHFFQKQELLTPLEGLKIQHLAQSLWLDPGHPGAPQPHYHGTFTYIGQKA